MPPPTEHTCLPLDTLETIGAGIPPDEPAERHLAECPACSRALAQIREDNALLGECAVAVSTDFDAGDTAASLSIPGYEILDEIHRGGQGVVSRAHHHATNRDVALKLLLHGALATPEQRARFEREAELVANLNHPGIVTVFDSGISPDGRPYLSMELVEGRTLSEHLQENRSGLSQRRILDLYARICDAVHYAHQRGIIHRDLKPSNIIIDPEGNPRVLDFGIARAVHGEPGDEKTLGLTRTGQFVGTFVYASPEQVSRDAVAMDVRTDVYSIGVMLYESLTGQRPYALSGSLAEVIRTIQETDAAPPSDANPSIRNEVETILLKALNKDPERRYQSAGELRDDIRRYLRGDPIEAKRDSRLYVVRKVAWKHRYPLGAAAAFVGLAIGALVWVLAEQTQKARVSDTVNAGILSAVTDLSDKPVNTREDVFDRFAAAIEQHLANYPNLRADKEYALGVAYLDTSAFDKAVRHLALALELRRQRYGPRSVEVAQTLHQLGRAHWHRGAFDDAEGAYTRARDLRRDLLGDDHADYAVTTQHLASTLSRQARYDEARPLYEEAVNIARTNPDTSPVQLANALNSLSTCLWELGEHKAAKSHLREAIGLIDADDWRAARMRHTLGIYSIDDQEFDEAERHLRESLRVKIIWRGEEDRDAYRTRVQLCRLIAERALWLEQEPDPGDLARAIDTCRAALDIERELYPGAHPDLASTLQTLGQLLLLDDRPEQALRQFDAARDMWLELSRTESDWRVTTLDSLRGSAIAAAGNPAEGRRLMRSAHEALLASRGEHDHRTRSAALRLQRARGSEPPTASR